MYTLYIVTHVHSSHICLFSLLNQEEKLNWCILFQKMEICHNLHLIEGYFKRCYGYFSLNGHLILIIRRKKRTVDVDFIKAEDYS